MTLSGRCIAVANGLSSELAMCVRVNEEFDCRAGADAAMRMAVATSGLERHRWVQVAMAWQALGHNRQATADLGQRLQSFE
jgi:hypothetical protein